MPLTEVVGALSALRVTAASGTPVAAATDSLTIKAVDQFGNTVTTYTGSHALTFGGLANSIIGNVPTVAGVNLRIFNQCYFRQRAKIPRP